MLWLKIKIPLRSKSTEKLWWANRMVCHTPTIWLCTTLRDTFEQKNVQTQFDNFSCFTKAYKSIRANTPNLDLWPYHKLASLFLLLLLPPHVNDTLNSFSIVGVVYDCANEMTLRFFLVGKKKTKIEWVCIVRTHHTPQVNIFLPRRYRRRRRFAWIMNEKQAAVIFYGAHTWNAGSQQSRRTSPRW